MVRHTMFSVLRANEPPAAALFEVDTAAAHCPTLLYLRGAGILDTAYFAGSCPYRVSGKIYLHCCLLSESRICTHARLSAKQ